jgi:hypothetical protein
MLTQKSGDPDGGPVMVAPIFGSGKRILSSRPGWLSQTMAFKDRHSSARPA